MNRPLTSPGVASSYLGAVFSPRWGGLALVDRFGLPDDRTRRVRPHVVSLRAARTARARALSVRRHLRRVLHRHPVDTLVLGVVAREDPLHAELRAEAEATAREAGVAVRSIPLRDVRTWLLGAPKTEAGALATTLVTEFFPELASELDQGLDARRYRVHAWNALALALTALGETHPRAALALQRRGSASRPAFTNRLLDRDRHLFPSDYAALPHPSSL